MARARGSLATSDRTATSAVVGHVADDAKSSNSQADQNEEAHRSHSLDLRKGTLIGFRIGATCSVLTHNGRQPAHREATTLGAVGWQCQESGWRAGGQGRRANLLPPLLRVARRQFPGDSPFGGSRSVEREADNGFGHFPRTLCRRRLDCGSFCVCFSVPVFNTLTEISREDHRDSRRSRSCE